MRAEGDGNQPHWLKRTKRETAMIPATVLVRCIANCLETSRYYASKGNRPLADWWDDRAKVFAHRLATKSYRKHRPRLTTRPTPTRCSKRPSRQPGPALTRASQPSVGRVP